VTGKALWTAPQEKTNGIVAMDFSAEGRYLATLSNAGELLLGWAIPLRTYMVLFLLECSWAFLRKGGSRLFPSSNANGLFTSNIGRCFFWGQVGSLL
jgi:hypothetical protein